MDSKVLIIAVVAAVVVAGAGGAYFIMSGSNSNSSSNSVNLDDYKAYSALVFGNADGNTVIDSADITVINDIIAGTKSFNDYKLADANRDGKVTSDDATIVQDIIDDKATSVKVIDCHGEIVDTPYPIKTMFFSGMVNARAILNVLDLQDEMVAFATNSTVYGKELDKQVLDKVDSGDITLVTSNASDDDFTKLSKLKFQAAVLEDRGQSEFTSTQSMKKLNDFGATCLRFDFDNVTYSLQTVATIGVLVKNTTPATSYVNLLKGVLGTIEETVTSLPEDKKSTCLSVTMSNSVSGTESDYYAATETAGGKQIADWSETTKKFDPSNGDTWLYEKKYNADYIFHFKSQDFNVSEDTNIKNAKSYAAYFSETYTFQKGGYYLINGVIPLPARLAYIAEILYPSEIKAGYGQEIFQSYIDNYTGQTIDVKDYKVYWKVSDLIKYKAPTSITLSGDLLSDKTVSLGLSATTDLTVTTDGTVYYPSITNSNKSVCTASFVVNNDNTGGTLTLKAGTTAGSTTITITTGPRSETITVNVSDIAATAIELSSDAISIGIGASASLSYDMTPANASVNNFSLKSSDESVVKIGDGYITGLKAGTAKITVTVGSVSDTCDVTVSEIAPTKISLLTDKGKDSTMMGSTRDVGYQIQLDFSVTAANASIAGLTITSDHEDILTVSYGPIINGVAKVTVTKASNVTASTDVYITAELSGLEQVKVKVTVK